MNSRLGVRVKMSRRWQDEEVSFCMPRRHELTDEQWELIEDLFPENAHHRGGQWKDHRMMLNAIFWWLRTGAPWRDLPERYGLLEDRLRPLQPLAQRRHLRADHRTFAGSAR